MAATDCNATEAPPGLDTVEVAGAAAGCATDHVVLGVAGAGAGCKAVETRADHEETEAAPRYGSVLFAGDAVRYEAAVEVTGATAGVTARYEAVSTTPPKWTLILLNLFM